MLKERVKERREVAAEDCWNVEALYPSLESWESDFKEWGRPQTKPHWPEIAAFKDKIGENPEKLRALLTTYFDIERHLYKLHTYSHLKHDEDVAAEVYKNIYGKMTALYNDFRQETAWIDPEILQLSDAKLKEYLNSSALKEFRTYLEKLVRLKPHTLSADKEELLALAGRALETSSKAFSSFNNADLKFPKVHTTSGEELDLSQGKYQLYLQSSDRTLRREAFQTLHRGFLSYENTLCDLINGQVQTHLFEARARNYNSCLEAALFPHQIDVNVYHALIRTVRKHLPSLHRYVELRKKVLGYDKLHLYDMSMPLVMEGKITMDYLSAQDVVIESVGPLGSQYQSDLQKGLIVDRWVDRYENARKRTGAYSSGCYDSMPYILMNYQGTYRDVSTLAHEAGHSMHTLLSTRHQPYWYSNYPIFVAEVASTFNEELLVRHVMQSKSLKPQETMFLINQKIDDIRSTLFRQVMFAEFELKLHEWAEKDVPLTPALLKAEYRKLNQDYFGDSLIIDEEIDIEWARIPHFYYNFYVYQYATGISAALSLVEKVTKEGERAREKYLKFLSSGNSLYPVELLKIAGVDMTSEEPVAAAIRQFDQLVKELEQLLLP